tara:strand:+ start:194 stop:481 length:288 start_codon:yes stop_codon:yes gene_type:complete
MQTTPTPTLVVSVNEMSPQKSTFFKLKTTTKMKKLLKCYAQREGIRSHEDVVFLFTPTTSEEETSIICEEHMTPGKLGLSEGDQIWCKRDQKAPP